MRDAEIWSLSPIFNTTGPPGKEREESGNERCRNMVAVPDFLSYPSAAASKAVDYARGNYGTCVSPAGFFSC